MVQELGQPCWTTPVQSNVVSDIGALGLDEDAAFLATHVELPIRWKKGGAGTAQAADLQRTFQSAIEANEHTNTVIAITGRSGSGKSHLVRWIRANLSLADDQRIVYVPRAKTSLEGVLDLVLGQFETELAEDTREEVKTAVSGMTDGEFANSLHSALVHALRFNVASSGDRSKLLIDRADAAEQETLGRDGLSELVNDARSSLVAADGVLGRLAASLRERGGVVDEEPEEIRFEDTELAALGQVKTDQGTDKHKVKVRLDTGTKYRTAALELLNHAVDLAVVQLFRLTEGNSLQSVFQDVRAQLAGSQLILMFEDLALLDFVASPVLNEVANHGNAESAPLRVVFAVTDDKFRALAETLEGRITSHVECGELEFVSEDGVLAPSGAEFLARYLNLARVGRARVLESQASEGLPTRCSECEVREPCFEGFGFVELGDAGGVGLFPYTEVALRRSIGRLASDRHAEGRTLTPRAVIDRLIISGLGYATTPLSTGSAPDAKLRSVVDDGEITRSPEELLSDVSGADKEQRERIYAVRAFWMDETIENEAIARAFALPTDGEEPVARCKRCAQVLTEGGHTCVPDCEECGRPLLPGHSCAGKPVPEVIQKTLQWLTHGSEAFDQKAVEVVRDRLLSQVESRVDLRPHLIAPQTGSAKVLLRAAVGRGSFQIEDGGGAVQGSQFRFELPRCEETYRLIVGVVWFHDHAHWDFTATDRKWDLPKLPPDVDLAVDVEVVLDGWARQVESAIVAATLLHGDGASAAALAVRDSITIEKAGVRHLPEWSQVRSAAAELLSEGSTADLVSTLAVGQGTATGDPVVLDAVRTEVQAADESGVDATVFPAAHKQQSALTKALGQAVPAALQAAQHSRQLLDTLPEGATVQSVSARAAEVLIQANGNKFFDSSTMSFLAATELCHDLEHLPDLGGLDIDASWDRASVIGALAELDGLVAAGQGIEQLVTVVSGTRALGEELVPPEIDLTQLRAKVLAVRDRAATALNALEEGLS